ncbi:MAG: hypothetical protein MJB12_00045 [Firmicutes bacterium]|nr:hypothetical protein [Bacillota bacterium]
MNKMAAAVGKKSQEAVKNQDEQFSRSGNFFMKMSGQKNPNNAKCWSKYIQMKGTSGVIFLKKGLFNEGAL